MGYEVYIELNWLIDAVQLREIRTWPDIVAWYQSRRILVSGRCISLN